MRRRGLTLRAGAVMLAGTIILTLATMVIAQVSSNYDLSWYIIDGGGGRMESSGHTMHFTLGQPVTGQATSGGHSLCSGFWCGEGAGYEVYLPLVVRALP